MPLNRLALIRYRTIDECLRNRARRWTLDDLMDACSDALYELEGIDRPVSRRTVQYDIQAMRSDKLGYEAPIVVIEKKYYTYSDPDYGIMQGPLNPADLEQLGEAVAVLKQFQGFGHLEELGGLVQKLEDKVSSGTGQPAILLESNERLRGLEYLEELFQAVRQQKVVRISYQSFKAKQPSLVIIHPLLLREFNNRWFLVGCTGESDRILSFALDRMQGITYPSIPFIPRPQFDANTYYQHIVGVTVNNMRPMNVRLWLDHRNAPYVLTKPLHPSQTTEMSCTDGSVVVRIRVIPNFELERLLIGFGPSLRVLRPKRLRRRIAKLLEQAAAQYRT